MYEFEHSRMRSAELRRSAQRERLAREVVRAGRVARRAQAAARQGRTDAESPGEQPRGSRLPRTA
jgi:hypothetical protein